MPGISHSVTPVVDEIGKMHIEGNIIPPSWLNHLCTKKGKPSALAAMILGDIIYWYRPTVIRDEQTGQVVEVRKKFSADKLQRDTRYYVQLFGCTKWQALEPLNVLLAASVIMREPSPYPTARKCRMYITWSRCQPRLLKSPIALMATSAPQKNKQRR